MLEGKKPKIGMVAGSPLQESGRLMVDDWITESTAQHSRFR